LKKLLIIAILFYTNSLTLSAQVTFEKQFGLDTTDDIIYSSIENSKGEFIFVGTSDPGWLDLNGDSSTIIFIKTNHFGDTIACFRNQFASRSCVNSILELPNDSGYILAGYNWEESSNIPPKALLIRTDTAGILQWYRIFVGYNQWNASISQVILTYDNNLFLLGHTQDSTPVIGGFITSFLLKTDLNGNIIWQKNYSKHNYSIFLNASQTADSGLILCGQLDSGSYDYSLLLMKTDSSGNLLWTKTFKDSDPSYLSYQGDDVKEDLYGNFIVVGTAYYTNIFKNNIFLLKTDPSGNIIYNKIFGDSISEIYGVCYGWDLSIDQSGYSIFGFSEPDTSIYPAILIRTDTSGIITKNKLVRLNSPYNFTYYSGTRTSDSGYLYNGYTTSLGGDRNGVVIKLDSSGWGGCNSIDTSINDFSRAFITGTDTIITSIPTLINSFTTFQQLRQIHVSDDCPATNICSANFSIYADTAQQHHYIIINNASGISPINYYWIWGDGTNDYTPYPSHTYADSGYYNICLTIVDGTGCTNMFCDSSYFVHRPLQSNSMVYVNVYSQWTVGIKEMDSPKEIFIYPNPTQGQFTIRTQFAFKKIEIYNMLGETIFSEQSNQTNSIVNTKLQSGIYFVKINDGKNNIVRKIVVE
jgi:hypothetical protein